MKKIVETDKAPRAIGPYSQAVVSNGFIFVSGQIPIDPETGEIVGGEIEEQTASVIKNIGLILEGAGSSLDAVVKTTVYMVDLEDFPLMNRIYSDFFEASMPARATVQVSSLPKGAKIEIDAVAMEIGDNQVSG